MRKERFTISQRCRTIVFLAAPQSQILDIAGPLQVFVRAAERFLEMHPGVTQPYAVKLLSTVDKTSVQTNCSLALSQCAYYRDYQGPIDTLLIAGGSGVEEAAEDGALLAWLCKNARSLRRIGSICTGAYLLAAAGLLDGKRATTHWQYAGRSRAKVQKRRR
jgi:transcriptional regulator GlxA family with amidase domain